MLNSIGLQGPGVDALLTDHLPRLAALEVPLWVSVGGFSAADFASVCEQLDEREEIATIELDLSCPNVEEAPETRPRSWRGTGGDVEDALRQALAGELGHRGGGASRRRRRRRRALVVNTIRGLALDPRTLRPRLAPRDGRYSGPALKPIALACVFACAQAVDCPVVGMGGVASGIDALELLAAGASAVALGTICSPIRPRPRGSAAELEAEAGARGFDRAEREGIAIETLQICRDFFRLTTAPVLLDSAPMVTSSLRPSSPPLARSADGGSEAGERHSGAARAAKKDLKDGARRSRTSCSIRPDWVETAKVFDRSWPFPSSARQGRRLLNSCRISQSKTVGGLSERQRAELVSLFNR